MSRPIEVRIDVESQRATGAFAGLTASITSAGIAMVQAGIQAGIEAIGNSIELASDKAESASKVNVIFADSADQIHDAADRAATTVGLSSGAYLEAAGNLGNLLKNFDLSTDAAADMSQGMIDLAADVGSFNNADPSEVVEAMGAAMRGESEPMRRFGVLIDEASIKAKGMALGVDASSTAVDKSGRAQAIYALMLEQTIDAQGDFARTSDGLANSQRINAARMEDAWTRVGETLMPIVEWIMPMVADAIVGIVDTIGMVFDAIGDWIDQNQALIGTIGDLVGGVLDVFGGVLGVIFDVLGDVAALMSGPVDIALGVIRLAFELVAGAVRIFVDAVKLAGDALHDLQRFMDPHAAAMEDAGKQFRELAAEHGLGAEEIERAWAQVVAAAGDGSLSAETDIGSLVDAYILQRDAAAEMAGGVTEATREATRATSQFTVDTDDMAADVTGRLDDLTSRFGEVPPEIAAHLDQGSPRVARSAVDMATEIPDALDAARRDSVEIAQQTPGALADGLRSRRDAWRDALDTLGDDLKSSMDRAKEIAELESALAGKKIQQGLASTDPIVRAQTQHTVDLINERLADLGQIGEDAGEDIGQGVADGLRRKFGSVSTAAEQLAGRVRGALELASPARTGPWSERGGPIEWMRRNADRMVGAFETGLGKLRVTPPGFTDGIERAVGLGTQLVRGVPPGFALAAAAAVSGRPPAPQLPPITIQTGVGDPVAIGRELYEVLRAYHRAAGFRDPTE